ncbi:diacylglycerol O-acyltransferase 1-like [Diadema antillarum]|uniref:diacylglycerol O-acyltransferase 1-like n=1 Tax=Diadema antillarum TaxID=105358 RepID=UPI003A8944E4
MPAVITADHHPEFDTRPDKPMHISQPSLLSHTSGFNNYRGLLNLCIVLLGMSTSRLVLENLIKYGILMDPRIWFNIFLEDPYSWPNLALIIFLNFFILFALWIEKLASKDLIGPQLTKGLVVINTMTVFLFPMATILYLKPNPLGSFVSLGAYTIVFLKLISYAATNQWCRAALKQEGAGAGAAAAKADKNREVRRSPRRHSTPQQTLRKRSSHRRNSDGGSSSQANGNAASDHDEVSTGPPVNYPDNLNIVDIYYFMMVPTLCYELNFPRTKRMRKRFLIRRVVELVFLTQLCLCLIQQWMIPTVLNGREPFTNMDVKRIVERVLKLAVPNHIVWLIFFYAFFHSLMNISAEVCYFADRRFYLDWWNSETIAYFWKNWNIPVHRWCVRHIYKPLRDKGYSRKTCQLVVFLVSAIFHEYLVSIPLQMFRLWAFFGMLLQLPLALLTERVDGHLGNMLVWLSLIIGQPVAIFLYFHDYLVLHGTLLSQVANATATP